MKIKDWLWLIWFLIRLILISIIILGGIILLVTI
jgi:hypothetical protein